MKKIKLLFAFIFIFLSSFLFTSCDDNPYDEIQSYTVTITPNENGTLNISYNVVWDVLISGSEDYIMFGIPNDYAKIIDYSDSVARATLDTSDGSYVRLDLYDSFKKGQRLYLNFTILQRRLYQINEENGCEYVNYHFRPGWFDDIEIKKLTVKWYKDGVEGYGNKGSIEGDYIVWSKTDLKGGETIDCRLYYDINYFPSINRQAQAPGEDISKYIVIGIVAVFIFCIGIIIYVSQKYEGSGYYSYRGFYPTRRRFRRGGVGVNGKELLSPSRVYSSGVGGSRGSSCACACACAGGGRAGCSRKDFYKNKKDVEAIIKALE